MEIHYDKDGVRNIISSALFEGSMILFYLFRLSQYKIEILIFFQTTRLEWILNETKCDIVSDHVVLHGNTSVLSNYNKQHRKNRFSLAYFQNKNLSFAYKRPKSVIHHFISHQCEFFFHTELIRIIFSCCVFYILHIAEHLSFF